MVDANTCSLIGQIGPTLAGNTRFQEDTVGKLVVVELPMRSGLPKDKVTNTYAIGQQVPGSAARDDEVITAITRLYTVATASSGGQALSGWLGPQLSRVANACSVKVYDITGHLDGSPHGSPRAVSTFTLGASLGNDPMPEEVALCCTLEAHDRGAQRVEVPDGADPDAKPDRPRQRYTGRVYFGPWQASESVVDANVMARPNATIQVTLREAMKRLADEIDTTTNDENWLGVWSRADRAIREVEFVRTDDAWDTQRRRGNSPTAITRLAVADAAPIEVELGA